MPETRHISLFAGAGGAVLAGVLLGWRMVGVAESDRWRRELLWRRLAELGEDAEVWEDVADVPLREVDVLSAGFPCQVFSRSGKRENPRGHPRNLWPLTRDALARLQPAAVLLENSERLLLGSHRYGEVVIRDLLALGYGSVRWGLLSAWHVGAWHLRQRAWIIAVQGPPPEGRCPVAVLDKAGCWSLEGSLLGQRRRVPLPPWGAVGRDGVVVELAGPATRRQRCDLLPTPVTSDERYTGYSDGRRRGSLVEAVEARRPLLPTPLAEDGSHGCSGRLHYERSGRRQLSNEVERPRPLPTSTLMEGGRSAYGLGTTLSDAAGVTAGGGLRLNPDWVEWLQGWPVGWSSPARAIGPEWMESWLLAVSSAGGYWQEEPPLPRTVSHYRGRRERLRALGDGWVPRQAATAWEMLNASHCADRGRGRDSRGHRNRPGGPGVLPGGA